MLKLLLAVDGSESSMRAVEYLIKRISSARSEYQLHLINVQPPLHGDVATFIDGAQLKQYHHDEGMKAMEAARTALESAGVPFEPHLFVGEPAETIVRFARERTCDEIVVGARGASGFSSLLMGSVASKVLHLAEIPVLMVK